MLVQTLNRSILNFWYMEAGVGKTIIYLDLDGCFADFDSEVRRVYGQKPADWGNIKWSLLETVPNFFLNLKTIPGSVDAFNTIMSLGYETQILTALPKPTKMLVTSAHDKLQWVRKHLHPTIQVNCAAGWRNKVNWVHRKHILIDDMQRNIDHWNESGGKGIHHNGDWHDTIKRLNAVL
jgi:hypothetical protein